MICWQSSAVARSDSTDLTQVRTVFGPRRGPLCSPRKTWITLGPAAVTYRCISQQLEMHGDRPFVGEGRDLPAESKKDPRATEAARDDRPGVSLSGLAFGLGSDLGPGVWESVEAS